MSGGGNKRPTTRLLPPIKNPLFNPNQGSEEVRVAPLDKNHERVRSGRLGGLTNFFTSRHQRNRSPVISEKPSSSQDTISVSNYSNSHGSRASLRPPDAEARGVSPDSARNLSVNNDSCFGDDVNRAGSADEGKTTPAPGKQPTKLLRRGKERPFVLEKPVSQDKPRRRLSASLSRENLRSHHSDSEVVPQNKSERNGLKAAEEAKGPQIQIHDIVDLRDEWRLAKDSGNYKNLLRFLTVTFNSFASLCAVFKKNESFTPEDFNESGIDYHFVRGTYDILLTIPQEVQKNVLKSIINSLLQDAKRQRNKDDLRAYVILLQNPQFNSVATYVIFAHLLRQMSHLTDGEHQYLVHWFRRIPGTIFKAMVTRIQQFISTRLFPTKGNELPPDAKCTWWIPSAVKVLALLNAANGLSSPPVLGHIHFYNHSLDHIDLMGEYYSWQNPGANAGKFSFCQYPFILSLGAKRYVMQKDSESQMIVMARKSLVEKVQKRQMPDMGMLFLNIMVRRAHLISDSLNEIARKQKDLKKKLKVTFAGEPGLDMGGLTKEWFLLLIRRIFQPEYGMFTYNDKSRTYWFSTSNVESDSEFNLVGVLMGLAVYNSIILDIRFPACCYKKLLSPAVVPYQDPHASVGVASLGLQDLMEAMPDLGHGLKELLEYDGDVENDLCQTFQISYSAFGEVVTHNLKPGGNQIPVTNKNREEYVQLYVDYLLNKSIYRQFASFYHGFHSVCASNALIMLRPEEVEMLVCGNPDFDMDALKKVTVYDGYSSRDATIRYFWDVVFSLSLDLKKKLLLFVTGSDRVPIGGMGEMEFKIVRMDIKQSTRMLPMAHTCFNQLCLPPYKSRKLLKEKLTIAVSNAEGFGIE